MLVKNVWTTNFAPLRGDPIRKKTKAPVPPRRGAGSIVAPFLVFSGLLLAALIADVAWLMPQKKPETPQQWVSRSQSEKNFIMAKKMITPLLPPSPPVRWSVPIHCGEIGRGIWYAEGLVGIDSAPPVGLEVSTPWKAIFVPATSQPLYLGVGKQQKGDFAAALSLAGYHHVKP